MYYSLIGCLAVATLIIINFDVLIKREDASEAGTARAYRRFLYAIIFYYVTDILWGALDSAHLPEWLFAETEVYFIAMALCIRYWTRYVIEYLDRKNTFRIFLYYAGQVFFVVVLLLTVLNIGFPVIFWFDEQGGYHTGAARCAILVSQILILLLTVIYALYTYSKTDGSVRRRHLTIGLSGLIMLTFIYIQLFFPLLPLYSIACMLGSCLLRSFVVEYEKEEYRKELESALLKEKQHIEELGNARKAAYTDSLTGVKSKSAYADYVQELQKRLEDGGEFPFAFGMFDCNNLKPINDQFGHEKGDIYLKTASRLICRTFKHSPVFRIGGDEFVAILMNDDFGNREELCAQFERKQQEICASAENAWESVSIAIGLAVYDPKTDYSIDDVFERADRTMYEDKRQRKAAEKRALEEA